MALSSYLAQHARIPGNQVTLLVDGARTYPAMLAAIATAERLIVVESDIFAADDTGRRFVEALTERARAGVRVFVLIDGVGSFGTPTSFWQPLVAAGGQVQVYRPMRFVSLRKLYKRDHRKILTVDNRVAFIGGINISNNYAPKEWGGDGWHDAHAEVVGPAAHALSLLVSRTWRKLTRQALPIPPSPGPVGGPTEVQIFESLLSHRHSARKAYVHAMQGAKKSICITNAYCIPDGAIRRALRQACRRGVKVQLILAGKSDVPAVTYASRALYARLLRYGVELYEWNEVVLHTKTAVIDGTWCTIGSYNLDQRSLLHNLEANIACVDAPLGRALEHAFEEDLARSQRVDPIAWRRRSWIQKLLEIFFYQLRYLL